LFLGFFGAESGYFLQAADMFFLVFFQFCPFDIYNFNLAIEVFLDGFIFLDLFVNGAFLLVDGLFALLDPVF